MKNISKEELKKEIEFLKLEIESLKSTITTGTLKCDETRIKCLSEEKINYK